MYFIEWVVVGSGQETYLVRMEKPSFTVLKSQIKYHIRDTESVTNQVTDTCL